MKSCKAPNCSRPVFSHLFCAYHQYMRKMRGGDLYKKQKSGEVTTKKRKTPLKRTGVAKQSEKRKEETKTYKEVKDEIRAELIAKGEYNCFFCTKPMGQELGFHHLRGRDGKLFIEKKYLVPAHNDCHVWHYHQANIEQLLKEPWYEGFLSRLRAIEESLYFKELKKQEKGLFDEEN